MKKDKEQKEQEKAENNPKEQIYRFLSDYRKDVFSSISNRTNTYGKYYEQSSSAYAEMQAWTIGGGVDRAKISHYTAGALDIRHVREENGTYFVDTYEDFTIHYANGQPNSLSKKIKTYYLKCSGDSFIIYRIDVRNS